MLRPAIVLCAVALLAGCGSDGPREAPASAPTRADAVFVAHMLPHHQRAIAVGALAARRGADPRVRAFGRRIVREQTPEARRLTAWVGTLHVARQPQDAMSADGYITDATLARLRAASPATFDRDVLIASARSEAGAARMARAELSAGRYAPARRLAGSINTAPRGEIPQLRALAARLQGN